MGSSKRGKRVISAVAHSLTTPGFTSTDGIKTSTDSVSSSGAWSVKHAGGSREKVRVVRNNHILTTLRAAPVPAAVSEAHRQLAEWFFTTAIETTVTLR